MASRTLTSCDLLNFFCLKSVIADFVRLHILWSALVIVSVHNFPCYNVFLGHFHGNVFSCISPIFVILVFKFIWEYWELRKGSVRAFVFCPRVIF